MSIQFNSDSSSSSSTSSTPSDQSWTTLPKPGTAMRAIQMTRDSKPFFLQVTAVIKIDAFFAACFGAHWILAAKSIVNVSSPLAANNADLAHFASKVIKETPKIVKISTQPPQPPPPDYDEALKASQTQKGAKETLHFSCGTLTLHAETPQQQQPQQQQQQESKPPQQQQQQQQQQRTLTQFASTQINGRQYEALDPSQSDHCTSCSVCKK